MTSCYINMVRATSAGVSVMRFASLPQQPLFSSAGDGASPERYNRITGERN